MEIIKLNLIPSGVNPVCHCSQYDAGRVIRFELFDGLTPYTLSSEDEITLKVRKPDNTIVTAEVENTESNYIDIVTTEQMTACFGNNLGELNITTGEKVIGSLNFVMVIEKDPIANGDPSQSVIKDLDALVQAAVEADLGDNYYTKDETDELVATKASEEDLTALSGEVDNTVKKVISDEVNSLKFLRSELTTGIIQPNGSTVSSTSSGYTPIFAVNEGEVITAKKYYFNSSGELKGGVEGLFGTVVFFADDTQTYTNWGNPWNASLTSFVVPAGAKYCQVTINAIMTGTYTVAEIIRTVEDGDTNYYLNQNVFKTPSRFNGNLTANKIQTIGGKICVDNFILSATMTIGQNFSSVIIGAKNESGYGFAKPTIEITSTQIICTSNVSSIFDFTENHGLTITNDLQIIIIKTKTEHATIILQSGGERYTKTNANIGQAYYGFAILSDENINEVDVSIAVCDIYKPVWVCGDSWVTNYPERWYGQALSLGLTNFLKSGHAGETSANGLNGLLTLLSMYKPKMIVWLYGMNDADTDDSTPNADWLSSLNKLKEICSDRFIELVLATIPTTPTRNNNAKNEVVISSGYRYIDEVSAMGADNLGNWYTGYQSEDGNHTTESGAKALLVRVLADVPEIAIK